MTQKVCYYCLLVSATVSSRIILLLSNKDLVLPKKNNSKKRNIILGICGGIAAYKCADLVRRLKEQDFDVRVVMTESANQFITPMTLQAVSGYPVYQQIFDPEMEAAMGHIELARWADYVVIAPITANTMAKLVHGEADSLLTTLVLATQAKIIIAPAMNQQMWINSATQNNLKTLQQRGYHILGPAEGEQACGDIGAGRMLEPLDIAREMKKLNDQAKRLKGRKIVITAGPTVEAIDPVRFISNHSSGKMGYALAQAAKNSGADVVLISGPVQRPVPFGIKFLPVTSAAEMFTQVKQNIAGVDVFVGCAAVADYAPVEVSAQKIKKNDEQIVLTLKRNPDILAWVAEQPKRPFVVGFAAETQMLKEHAMQKLQKKKLDMICANDISCEGVGFNSDYNQLLLLDNKGNEKELTIDSKESLAQAIINDIAEKIAVM